MGYIEDQLCWLGWEGLGSYRENIEPQSVCNLSQGFI